PFGPWLFAIAHHLLAEYRERTSHGFLSIGDAPAADMRAVDERLEPLSVVVRGEQASDLLALIAALPEKHGRALLLRFYADRSTRETAAIMGCSEEAVRVYVFRGIQTLRARLPGHTEGQDS